MKPRPAGPVDFLEWRRLSLPQRSQSTALARRRKRMRRWYGAVSEIQRGLEGDRQHGRGHLVRVAAAAVMPGIMELPTLEELKVEEVRLSLRAGRKPGTAAVRRAQARFRPLRPAWSHPALARDIPVRTATGLSSCESGDTFH